jgi:hypothetical protein
MKAALTIYSNNNKANPQDIINGKTWSRKEIGAAKILNPILTKKKIATGHKDWNKSEFFLFNIIVANKLTRNTTLMIPVVTG